MLRSDPGRPRLTCYDDATGERIELSAKVLANWVAKAANLLQDDADAGPGTSVGLDLAPHWRALYWAMAAWSVGATVVVGPEATEADVVVTTDRLVAAVAHGQGRYAALVTLAALARTNPDTPAGVVDEARELAAYGDRFDPWAAPSGTDSALHTSAGDTAYNEVVSARDWPGQPRVKLAGALAATLLDALAAWALDGSVVLLANPRGDQGARLAAERVTVDLTAEPTES